METASEVWARKLTEMTADDDLAVDKDALVQLAEELSQPNIPAGAQSEAAGLLGSRLGDPSLAVKLKTIRVMMVLMTNVEGFHASVDAEAGDVLRQQLEYSCSPDPVHGSRPEAMIRSAAAKCLAMCDPAAAPDVQPPASAAPDAAPAALVPAAAAASAEDVGAFVAADGGAAGGESPQG